MLYVADQASELRKIVEKEKALKRTRTIAITSGKGGVGKTSLSVNLALMLRKMGEDVVLMDADLGLANVNVLLGITPEFTLYDVVKGNKKLEDIMVEYSGVKIIPGASGFSQLANIDSDTRERIITEFSKINDADIAIIDTAAGLSYNVLGFVLASTDVIVVTTPEPTSMADAYGIIKSIVAKGATNIKVVANRVSSIMEANKLIDKMKKVVKKFLGIDIEGLGFIFEDDIVKKSVYKQIPFVEEYPKSKSSICVEIIASKILDKEPPTLKDHSIASFFTKVFNFMK